MKLWIKSLIATSGFLGTAGASLGGMYLFSQVRNSDEKNLVKKNEINWSDRTSFDKDIKKEDIEAHFISLEAPYVSKDAFIGKYNYKNNTVVDFTHNKTVSWQKYRNDFVKEFNAPPKMVINLGSTIWKNEYVDAVNPKDFVDFAKWFIEENAWGPELFTLNEFTILNGVKKEGGSIILGDHANEHKEKTKIGFYPDAFFGISSIYESDGLNSNNLIFPIIDKKVNLELSSFENLREFTEEEIELFLTNEENNNSKIRYIQPLGIKKGKRKYHIYTDMIKNLLDDVAEKYPYLLKTIDGLHVVYDQNGKGTLENSEYQGFDLDTILPKIAVAGVADENFQGVGNDWIKFVTSHEYGHHTTLQEAQDLSGQIVALGALHSRSSYQDSSLYSATMFENYLKAKSKHLGFEFVDVNGKKAEDGPYFRFTIDGKPEEYADIYGFDKTFSKIEWDQEKIEKALEHVRRRALSLYKKSDRQEVSEFNQEKNISLFEMYLMNSWDNDSATINPTLWEEQAMAYDEKDGKLKKIREIFKQKDSETISKFLSGTYWAPGWEVVTNLSKEEELSKDSNPLFGQLFSNYVFNPAEQINRDFLQITYMPSKNYLKNRPKEINISEYNSGYEFFLDGTQIRSKYLFQENLYPYFKNLTYKNRNSGKQKSFLGIFFMFLKRNSLYNDSSSQNGFFGDDFYRRSLIDREYDENGNLVVKDNNGAAIYDLDGNPVKDQNIAIKDLNGNIVNDRAKAIWIYLLKTKGIGERNISGFWRNDVLDKMYFWGYLKDNEKTKKIVKIKFTNTKTKEVSYFPINKNVDNLFYYKKRGKNPEKHTLKDEGFVSWSTNYETIGDFQNSKLKLDQKYLMEFVDQNNNFVEKVSLGQKEHLTENGKSTLVSPVTMSKDKKSSDTIISIERKFA